MARNDTVLIDGILDTITSSESGQNRGTAFGRFALLQLLKDYDLTNEDISFGEIDGRQDGGIDGFYIFVNGHMIQTIEQFHWPKSNANLELVLVTAKHHDTFKQATLDALIATLAEVLDLSLAESQLKGAYSPSLLALRRLLIAAYRKVSAVLSRLAVSVYYASRGAQRDVGGEVRARAGQIEEIVRASFGDAANVRFEFIGASELVALHRKQPRRTLELPFLEAMSNEQSYLLLARICDYYNFVSEDGKLRRYLFDSNVRDFMGLNRVNEDIRKTLRDTGPADFWWLNNGVTVLVTAAMTTGKVIQLTDVQIVNGLQTTESVFNHYSSVGGALPIADDKRSILIKVIVSSDAAVRDNIIMATNNQTSVELSSLHATDKIQRDIEQHLLKSGIYYERRKNHYAGQGIGPREVVTPLYAASSMIAIGLRAPHVARRVRSRFMRNASAYAAVFDESIPLAIWPQVISIFKCVDGYLEELRPSHSERFLRNWRALVAFLVVVRVTGRVNYQMSDLIRVNTVQITREMVSDVYGRLAAYAGTHTDNWSIYSNVAGAVKSIVADWGVAYEPLSAVNTIDGLVDARGGSALVSDEFVDKVRSLLPDQPWKPRMHLAICAKLECTHAEFRAAVDILVANGTVLRQEDGVLFDLDGNVAGIDPERVDVSTLKLKVESPQS